MNARTRSVRTVQQLASDVVEEWHDLIADGLHVDDDLERFVAEAAAEAVPSMTTMLFQMVVDDNSLAFLEAKIDGGEPFTVLASAIGAAIERRALELIRDERSLNIRADRLVAGDGSVWVFSGVDTVDGDRVAFAADHRPAADVFAVIEAEGSADCEVEPWAILGREEGP